MKKMKIKVFPTILIAVFMAFWIALLSGEILWTSDIPPLEVIPDMDRTQSVKEQQLVTFFATRTADRSPVPYTVPRYAEIYRAGSPEEAEEEYSNTVPRTEWVVARGENRYMTFCMPCHGAGGAGDGSVAEKSATLKPPSLVSPDAKTRAFSDAHLFHIISAGQNIMPGYRDKMKEVDRWAVVHYMRALQDGGMNAHNGSEASDDSNDDLATVSTKSESGGEQ